MEEISKIDEYYYTQRKLVSEKNDTILSSDDENEDKINLLIKLGELKQHGIVTTKNYSIDSEINELRFEYVYQCEMIKK